MRLADYLRNKIDLQDNTHDSWSFRTSCPFCLDHKPRMYINVHSNTGYCHNCGSSFTAVDFVAKFDSVSYSTAAEYVKKSMPDLDEDSESMLDAVALHGQEALDRLRGARMVDDPPMMPVDPPDFATGLGSSSHHRWRSHPVVTEAHKYLRDRGLVDSDVDRIDVRAVIHGKYRGYVAFPVKLDGVIYSWVLRDTCTQTDRPKVVNTSKAKQSKLLFNYDCARHKNTIVVTEGIFDAVRTGPFAVASFGKKLSDAQVHLLNKSTASTIVLCFDADAHKDTIKFAERARALLSPNKCLRVCFLNKSFKDPGATDRNALRQMIKESPLWDGAAWFKDYFKAQVALQGGQ